MKEKFSIINETRTKFPVENFLEIKNSVLSSKYYLSLVITTPNKIKKLNLIYRNKNTATDILSFPISKSEGEIYICPNVARNKAKEFDRSYKNFCAFLFIHGCTHLKGHDHGAIMESKEVKVRKQFKI